MVSPSLAKLPNQWANTLCEASFLFQAKGYRKVPGEDATLRLELFAQGAVAPKAWHKVV
jgi:hypothetical protein